LGSGNPSESVRIRPNPTLYRIRPNPASSFVGSKCPYRLSNTAKFPPEGLLEIRPIPSEADPPPNPSESRNAIPALGPALAHGGHGGGSGHPAHVRRPVPCQRGNVPCRVLGPVRCCSPRHRIRFETRHGGSNALGDVAGNFAVPQSTSHGGRQFLRNRRSRRHVVPL
jgi:hypothetical protein